MRVVHCLNQFFAGRGGEEAAGLAPTWIEGAVGPGRLLASLAPDLEVIGTVAFGDDALAADPEAGAARVVELVAAWLREHPGAGPDLLIAGPAFKAGRYGLACGAICRAAEQRLGLPALTAMHPENPGVEVFRRSVTIVRAGADVMGMREAAEALVRVAGRLARGEEIAGDEDVLPRGLRQNVFREASGAERAVAMLLRKLRGEPFETEYAMPVFDRVPPAAPLLDPARATIALVTSGGIVPRGNPDHIESASASRFGEYPLEGLAALSPETHQSAHGGYDPTFANADPNRVLPVDAMRELESEGRFAALHPRYYATVGNGTSVESARRFGEEIAARLVNAGVQAVILTST